MAELVNGFFPKRTNGDNDTYEEKYGDLADQFEKKDGKAGGKRRKNTPTPSQQAQSAADIATLQQERTIQLRYDFASQLDYLKSHIHKPSGEMIFRRFYTFLKQVLISREGVVVLNKKDVRYQFTHSSGPGGQNVNKVATAVAATHLPTGIRVENRSTRHQSINKERALTQLTAVVAEHINTWRILLQGVEESELDEAVRGLLR